MSWLSWLQSARIFGYIVLANLDMLLQILMLQIPGKCWKPAISVSLAFGSKQSTLAGTTSSSCLLQVSGLADCQGLSHCHKSRSQLAQASSTWLLQTGQRCVTVRPGPARSSLAGLNQMVLELSSLSLLIILVALRN
jgi:hypothetical protein